MVKRITVALALVFSTALSAQQPTPAQIDALVDAAAAKLKADLRALYVPPATSIVVPLGASLQAAIVKAGVGATLQLAAGYETVEPIAIAKAIAIKGAGANLRGGLVITARGVSVAGGVIVSKQQARDDVVVLGPGCDRLTLTDFFVRGDRVRGQKRGILGNCSHATLTRIDVRDIWTARNLPGADIDSQAFACWDGCQDVEIVDSIFSGGTETFLVGGADAVSSLRQPARITLRRVTLTRDVSQRGDPNVLVKNGLELKNVDTFIFEDGTIEHVWAQGQGGYAIVLTPRNQGGGNTWAAVRHVTIANSRIQHAAALVSMLGTDDEKPSGPLVDVKLIGLTLADFNPKIWQVAGAEGSGQFIQVLRGPQGVTIDGLKIEPGTVANIGSSVYFADLPRATDFKLTNSALPISTYGMNGADSAPEYEDGRRVLVNGLPRAWSQWVASGTLAGNVER